MAMRHRFNGVFGVTITPFSADGLALDDDGVIQLCETMIGEGIEHLVPCGNTGEFYALTPAERRRVIELTVATAGGRASVVAGVGGAIPDAVEQIRLAERVRVDAVMIHHPVHPHQTEDGYLAYVDALASSSALPVVPYLKAPVLSEDGLRRLLDIEAVIAVKFGWNDLLAFGTAASLGQRRPEIAWICGTAESWAPFFWAAGAVGFTSGLVNVTAAHSLALLSALEAGDREATISIWRSIRPFEELRARRGDGQNVAVVKEALRQVGRPAGPVRPPASDVGAAEKAAIAELLEVWETAAPLVVAAR